MYGNKSLPSRFFSFGAKRPIEGAEEVERQMHEAHRYQNRFIEIERARREKLNVALAEVSPELVALEAQIAKAEEEKTAAEDVLKAAKVKARKNVRPPELVAAVNEAKVRLKPLYQRVKELRESTFSSPAWQVKQKELNSWENAEQKKLYAEYSGTKLFWATANHIKASMKKLHSGKPPKFRSWRGDGHLAVQVQLRGGKGSGENRVKGNAMSIAQLFSCTSDWLRVEPSDTSGSKAAAKRVLVWMRIGSAGKRKDPVWAKIPVVMHRPLPEDAQVRFAHLIRRRNGTHDEWQFQLVLSRASGWEKTDRASSGLVCIDVGWRKMEDGDLRVAFWRGSDGEDGELRLPATWLERMGKTKHIHSVRDQNFNIIREQLLNFLKIHVAAMPEWLREATKTLSQWRAISRMAALTLHWRGNRFSGDEEIFAALEAWRKRDRHLYDYESFLSLKLQRQRADIYRNFAAMMRRRYKDAVIEDMDLRDFHRLPGPEEEPEGEAMRRHTRDACLSFLRQCLKESMTIVKKNPKHTTMKCPKCGHVEDFDRKKLVKKCSACQYADDQDSVAADNLARASE